MFIIFEQVGPFVQGRSHTVMWRICHLKFDAIINFKVLSVIT